MENKFTGKIKPSTIVRCIVYIAVLINQVLAVCGKGLTFTSDMVYQIASIILTIVTGLWAAWKNNDFTQLARLSGQIFDALKDGSVTVDEAKDLLESADAIMIAEDEEDTEIVE